MLKKFLAPKLLSLAAAACLMVPSLSQAADCDAGFFYEFQYYGNEEVLISWEPAAAPSGTIVTVDGYYTTSRGATYNSWQSRTYECTSDGYWIQLW